ncbi:hypothetical protein BDY24DRAFT_443018 [Mrakia frigida]|uniref:homeobox domain-containing protein n=1 Tax=Mrakia frigida TaxID=29902 RepID=UPI003FCC166E
MSDDPFISRLSDVQIGILSSYYADHQLRYGATRPPVAIQRAAACRMSMVGEPVSSQDVGKWFTRYLRALTGQPANTRKTQEQLDLLNEEFDRNPLPNAHDVILLMESTGLDKKQVNAWFQVERKKYDEGGEFEDDGDLIDTSEQLSETPASIWRAYNRDPVNYVRYIRQRRFALEQQQARDILLAQEDLRHRAMVRAIDPARAWEMERRQREIALLNWERERDQRAFQEAQERERMRGMTAQQLQYYEMSRRIVGRMRGERF